MSSIASRLRLKRNKDIQTNDEGTDVRVKEKKPKIDLEEKEEDQKSSLVSCNEQFFTISCEKLARVLLGCVLCHHTSQGVCRGRIVETEAYLGGPDKASHSYNGRRTQRNEAMYMKPGTCYVYSIYGMYCCVNISSLGDGAAVLIRALEPLEGLVDMYTRRKSAKKDYDLCNGPSKLCQAMCVDKSCDQMNLIGSNVLWIEQDGYKVKPEDIIASKRIGVDYAEEWAESLLRFYIKGNKCVSKK